MNSWYDYLGRRILEISGFVPGGLYSRTESLGLGLVAMAMRARPDFLTNYTIGYFQGFFLCLKWLFSIFLYLVPPSPQDWNMMHLSLCRSVIAPRNSVRSDPIVNIKPIWGSIAKYASSVVSTLQGCHTKKCGWLYFPTA